MSTRELASLQNNVSLAAHCTLQLGGPAAHFVSVTSRDALVEALRFAASRALPVCVLGGGSNVIFADAGFAGLVIQMGLRGIEASVRGSTTYVRAQAGEPWDDVVAWTVARDLAGLECLSGIPGTVGATPIQNVGAYGQEVSQTIHEVEVLDRETLQASVLPPEACRFAYRHSAFKEQPDRYVVTAVTFALSNGGAPALHYSELARAMGKADPSLGEVRDTVVKLRRGKSMVFDVSDPNHRSVGSFFTNPMVPAAQADALSAQLLAEGVIANAAELPRYPQPNGAVKLSAAWLIERAGFSKGTRRGAVGISSAHSLALVHHGGGSAGELLEFAREIQARVEERFGVRLEREPVRVGHEG